MPDPGTTTPTGGGANHTLNPPTDITSLRDVLGPADNPSNPGGIRNDRPAQRCCLGPAAPHLPAAPPRPACTCALPRARLLSSSLTGGACCAKAQVTAAARRIQVRGLRPGIVPPAPAASDACGGRARYHLPGKGQASRPRDSRPRTAPHEEGERPPCRRGDPCEEADVSRRSTPSPRARWLDPDGAPPRGVASGPRPPPLPRRAGGRARARPVVRSPPAP